MGQHANFGIAQKKREYPTRLIMSQSRRAPGTKLESGILNMLKYLSRGSIHSMISEIIWLVNETRYLVGVKEPWALISKSNRNKLSSRHRFAEGAPMKNDYVDFVNKTNFMGNDLPYLLLGLIGEIGETIENKYDNTQNYEALILELGDVLWYSVAIMDMLRGSQGEADLLETLEIRDHTKTMDGLDKRYIISSDAINLMTKADKYKKQMRGRKKNMDNPQHIQIGSTLTIQLYHYEVVCLYR